MGLVESILYVWVEIVIIVMERFEGRWEKEDGRKKFSKEDLFIKIMYK